MRPKRHDAPDPRRGVYMISVAAELAGMHPQTLRIYESRGLITPKRSPGKTRLYSQADVERLRRIQQLTSEMGMNLAGVEKVFELEEELDKMRGRMDRLQQRTTELELEMAQEIENVKKQFRAEIVRYEPPRRFGA
jgi:MerR family transcriptional regulator/heat shock protein HspR